MLIACTKITKMRHFDSQNKNKTNNNNKTFSIIKLIKKAISSKLDLSLDVQCVLKKRYVVRWWAKPKRKK